MSQNTTEDSPDTRVELTALVGCGAVVLAVLVLTLVFAFFYSMYRAPVVTTLYEAEALTSFFANLFVVFYAFPAFRRTKNRAVLCIAFAALMFAYGALFTLLLGIRPPATAWHVGGVEVRWYYATRYTTSIIGLVLYAYGLISLLRLKSTTV